MNRFYTDYSEYLDRFFHGRKVQKISVNMGNTCPNRDGSIGTGGCIYCNNTSFTPEYCFTISSLKEQIEAGKRFFSRKYKDMDFLVYFQSYTNTYLSKGERSSNEICQAEKLRNIYLEALSIKGVVGLVIGTRPDCIDNKIIDILKEINQNSPIFVELGIETMYDDTLRLINRGHNAQQSERAIRSLNEAGLHVGVHLIAGLPGETEEMTLNSVKRICRMGVESIKLHHLQILRDTKLCKMVENKEINYHPWELENYLDFCVKVINVIPKGIAIERFLASAPPQLVISPKWGLKNYEFTNLLLNKLNKNE